MCSKRRAARRWRVGIWLCAIGVVGSNDAAGQAAPVPDGGIIARTERFVFRSDFRTNLHDFLYFVSRRDTSQGRLTVARCEGRVTPEAAERWLRAVQVYVDSVSQTGQFESPMIQIRYAMSGLPVRGMEMPSWVDPTLREAESVYRTCVWPRHAARNRVWSDEIAALIRPVETRMVAALEQQYGVSWEPNPIQVDVVSYVSRQGANSVFGPSHILVGLQGNLSGYSAVEIVFHEASHLLIGPRRGPIATAVNAAAAEMDVRLHPDLWHVILFYTTGMTTRQVLRDALGVDYEPYLYATGLFDRAWAALRPAVEVHWTPYVEGRASYADAARALVRAFAR